MLAQAAGRGGSLFAVGVDVELLHVTIEDSSAEIGLSTEFGGGVFAAEFAPLALGWRDGQAADPIRYVRLQVWGTGRNSFYGVAALRVFART